MDSELLTDAEAGHLLTFASQVQNPGSGVNGSGEVKAAVRAFDKERAPRLAQINAICRAFGLRWMLRKYCLAAFSTYHQIS